MALQKTKDKPVLKDLISVLCEKPLEEYNDFFAGTKVSGITDAKADKTMTSIRASITNKIQSLTSLAETDSPFSLKNYVAADNASWMFISSSANQRESLKPLISCWFNVLLTAIMERDPTRANKNVWIIVDELPSLEKIPKLKTALAEGRKYGGCVVAGLQNIHQLVTIYGRSEALDLIDQFNSRFIFRVGDQELANISSKMLGSAEISEVRESLSYGANTVRDGVNINSVERTKQLVLPSEITTLNDLQCYVKLAGSWPITKIDLQYEDMQNIAEGFKQKSTPPVEKESVQDVAPRQELLYFEHGDIKQLFQEYSDNAISAQSYEYYIETQISLIISREPKKYQEIIGNLDIVQENLQRFIVQGLVNIKGKDIEVNSRYNLEPRTIIEELEKINLVYPVKDDDTL